MSDLIQQPDFSECPLIKALRLVSGKWRIPVLCVLTHNTLRYSDIRRKLGGITNNMLAQILRDFEAEGLVDRLQFNEIPPHVEYRITPRGQQLIDGLHLIAGWTDERPDGSLRSEVCELCYRMGGDCLPCGENCRE